MYRVIGLEPAAFTHFMGASDDDLSVLGAERVIATTKPGYPCRISLQDAELGEAMILLNNVSHDVQTPYRNAYAIYVRGEATAQGDYLDTVPPVFEGRPLGLRAFDSSGRLRTAALALPGQADEKIRAVFADPAIAYIHAHNAAHGCFAARVDRA